MPYIPFKDTSLVDPNPAYKFSLDYFITSQNSFDGYGFDEGFAYQCVALVKAYAKKLNGGKNVGSLGDAPVAAYNLSKVFINGEKEFYFIGKDRGYYEMKSGDVVSTSTHTFILNRIERDEKGNVTKATALEQSGFNNVVKGKLKGYLHVKDQNGDIFSVQSKYEGNFKRAGINKVEYTDEKGNVEYVYEDPRLKSRKYKDEYGNVQYDITHGLVESDVTNYVNNRKDEIEVAQRSHNYTGKYTSPTDVELSEMRDTEGDTTIKKDMLSSMAKNYYGNKYSKPHITINIRRNKAKREKELSQYYWGGSW